ncbi:MAG: S16 family serine protease [Desulfococcaceae bacterium]|jgi:hypothetical protein|nr:S16 family serine protease [Desulfococcaceae bacterium]
MHPEYGKIEHLAYLAENPEMHEGMKQWLCRPSLIFLHSRGAKNFSGILSRIFSHLKDHPDLQKLLELHLVTEKLLFHEQLSENTLCRQWKQKYLPEIPPDSLSGSSCAVPVFLSGNGEIRLCWFLCAYLPHTAVSLWPQWTGFLLDKNAQQAVRNAALACIRMENPENPDGFCCYPLTVPNGKVQIRGKSLGLSVGLGFLAALAGETLPQEIAFTGEICPDAGVGKVGFTEEKAAAARREDFRLFLFPADNFAAEQTRVSKEILYLPVRNLRQARMLLQLYRPGQAGALPLFSRMMEDPLYFIRNIPSVPARWIDWARQQGYSSTIMEEIRKSPVLISALTDCLENLVRSSQNKRAEILSGLLFSEKEREYICKTAPLSAFRWAALNLCLNNHLGRIAAALKWEKSAETLLPHALRADVRLVSDYFNYVFIRRHNSYAFGPELPEGLRTVLALLEKQYAPQCEFGCRVHFPLGAVYGSITQNFAFCGPDYLAKVLRYSQKARRALGEHTVPEYREEWLRQYNYLSYAFLDAGKTASARQSLAVYLDAEDLLSGIDKFSQWQHALTARFLADTKGPESRDYFQWCREHMNTMENQSHPWQLWFWNMGRLAGMLGEKAESIRFFRGSLSRCLSQHFGSTVRLMALLPLSQLEKTGNLPENTSEIQDIIRSAAEKVNPRHFQILSEKKFGDALKEVRKNPEKWFPFTYR